MEDNVLMWKPNASRVFEAAQSFDHTLSSMFMTSHPLRTALVSNCSLQSITESHRALLTFNLSVGKINIT